VLIDNDYNARLSDFGLASFDRSHWPGVSSNSSDPGGTTAYMAPELFYREHQEGRPKLPLMRKEVDVYALGMLMYEVRLLIKYSGGGTLITLLGPVRKKTVLQCAQANGHPEGFPWGATATAINDTDPGSYLGNNASVLER